MPGIAGEKRSPWNFGSYSVEWILIPSKLACSDQGFCILRITHRDRFRVFPCNRSENGSRQLFIGCPAHFLCSDGPLLPDRLRVK